MSRKLKLHSFPDLLHWYHLITIFIHIDIMNLILGLSVGLLDFRVHEEIPVDHREFRLQLLLQLSYRGKGVDWLNLRLKLLLLLNMRNWWVIITLLGSRLYGHELNNLNNFFQFICFTSGIFFLIL